MNHEHPKKLNMKADVVLTKAIQQFNQLTGAVMDRLYNELNININHNADAEVELTAGNETAAFLVEVKTEFRDQNIARYLNKVKDKPGGWLLVCQYIPKPLKEILRKQGLNYLEVPGNCFIRRGAMFFYINDKAVTAERQPKEGKLWKQAGLKFLFGILIKPELLNQPYRQTAMETNIALGNIGPFIAELREEGFLKEGSKDGHPFLFIENKALLQNKWIELFNAILKPKLKQGRFRFVNNEDEKKWELLPAAIPYKFYWGGEPAAAMLTGHLQPEIFTIYTKEAKTNIMKQLRLVPDRNGNVEILDIFWKTELLDFLNINTKTVHPFLAYAELLTSLDSRNRETAERIKQQYLD